MVKQEIIYTLVYAVKDGMKRLIVAMPTRAAAEESTIQIAYDSFYADSDVVQSPDEMRERYFKAFCIAYRQENPNEITNILGYFGSMNLLNEGEGMMISFNRRIEW